MCLPTLLLLLTTTFLFLSDFCNVQNNLILLGNFNFPDILVDWVTLSGHSTASNQLCDAIFQAGLCQLIDVPTHQQENILDLLTNIEDKIEHLQIHSDPHLQYIVITTTLSFQLILR